jgi:omega-6 fatty acid desaturase (delta-12 desaturase)
MSDLNAAIRSELRDWPRRFRAYAQPHNGKAAWQVLTSFLPFFGLWVLMYYSLSWSYWITLALALVNAFFVVRIFIIQHDCGHRSFLKNQRVMHFIGWVSSLITFIPYTYWAKVHDFHHAHSGQLEVRDIGDIYTMTVEEYQQAGRWKRLGYRLFRMPLITFVIGPVIYLLYNNRFQLVKLDESARTRWLLRLNNLLLLAACAGMAYWLGWQTFLLIQAPIVVFFAIIAVWFFYVQHQHEHSYKHWRDQWEYLLAAVRGSSFYRLPRLFHWLTGNIGYHHLHHLNSKIPSYNLPRAHQENRFLEQYVTDLRFGESLRCMFHKLWDEETERMITFREYRQLVAVRG